MAPHLIFKVIIVYFLVHILGFICHVLGLNQRPIDSLEYIGADAVAVIKGIGSGRLEVALHDLINDTHIFLGLSGGSGGREIAI